MIVTFEYKDFIYSIKSDYVPQVGEVVRLISPSENLNHKLKVKAIEISIQVGPPIPDDKSEIIYNADVELTEVDSVILEGVSKNVTNVTNYGLKLSTIFWIVPTLGIIGFALGYFLSKFL